jgi:hypothetical protein
LPVALVAIYVVALIPELPTIVSHTWWSADSGTAGVIAHLYRRPPARQYIVLGDHGWYEALGFYLLTRGLALHRLLWYAVPAAAWVGAIALVGLSAGRAFGRYGAGLAVGSLLCLAPAGLMVVFQPTAHTNVIFHAAALAAVAGWVLPRIRTLPLPVVLGAGTAIGAFTGLAIAGDAIALAWAVLPFVVAAGVCARRGPLGLAARTIAFALAALVAMLIITVVFTATMHSAGFRVDELAQSAATRFVKPTLLSGNVGKLIGELAYFVGGNFLGHRIGGNGYLEVASGGALLLGCLAVLFALYRTAIAAERPAGGSRADSRAEVSPRLVHVAFWGTCLTVGLLMFLLSSVGTADYRYLLGPLVAIGALLPLVASRRGDWRIVVAAGLSVMALAGLVRLATRPVPWLPVDRPLASRDIATVIRFAHRHDATYGYAVYWDAVAITWHTGFAVRLYPVRHCSPAGDRYCPLYHADSFTAAYAPGRVGRSLFIADARFGSAPAPSWGRPIASERVGRLALYAYDYDIADRFPKPRPGEIQQLITGNPAPAAISAQRSPISSTARKASCGTSTRPTCFIRFLPFFWASSSLRLRLMSPP